MGHILPEEGLSIKQLLHTLREQLAYTMFAYSLPASAAPADTSPANTNLLV